MRLVPAGVSKKTGKPYDAFFSCSQIGCNTTARAEEQQPVYEANPPIPVVEEKKTGGQMIMDKLDEVISYQKESHSKLMETLQQELGVEPKKDPLEEINF